MVYQSVKKVRRDDIYPNPEDIFRQRQNYQGIFPKGWFLRYFDYMNLEEKPFRQEVCTVFNTEYFYYLHSSHIRLPYVYKVDGKLDMEAFEEALELDAPPDESFLFGPDGSWGILLDFDLDITLIGSKEKIRAPFHSLDEFETKEQLIEHLKIYVDVNTFKIDWGNAT